MPTASSNVRVRGQSGKHLLVLSSSQFDPKADIGLFQNAWLSRYNASSLSLGGQHEAADVYRDCRRRGCYVAACGARATIREGLPDRLPRRDLASRIRTL